jgi:hypothetical protein
MLNPTVTTVDCSIERIHEHAPGERLLHCQLVAVAGAAVRSAGSGMPTGERINEICTA